MNRAVSYLIVASLTCGQFLLAQDVSLYSTTYYGGKANGSLVKADINGNDFEIAHEFGASPHTEFWNHSLLEAEPNVFYGTSIGGLAIDNGYFFRYDRNQSQLEVLYYFGQYFGEGYKSGGYLVQLNNRIYGVAKRGGEYGFGLIFEYDTQTDSFRRMLSFDTATTGFVVGDGFLKSSDNKLYLTLSKNSNQQRGSIATYDPVSNQLHFVYEAQSDTLHVNTEGPLYEARDGLFYGVSHSGGMHDKGLLFVFNPADSSCQDLHHFDGSDGRFSKSKLTEGERGVLYGMTGFGGQNDKGVFFSFDTENELFQVITHFSGSNGALPWSNGLMTASDGKVYGMTYDGGQYGQGAIFSCDTLAHQYQIVHSFDQDVIGDSPSGTLIESGGELVGLIGGKVTASVFRHDLSNQQVAQEWIFPDWKAGVNPWGNLLKHSSRDLIGITEGGGKYGQGTLYRFDPEKNEHEVLFNFNQDTILGHYPRGALVEGPNGVIYGTTYNGGIDTATFRSGSGVLFAYDTSSGDYRVIKSFFRNQDGAYSRSGLYASRSNVFFGTTFRGGQHNLGTLFSYDPVQDHFQKLADFDNSIGFFPDGRLTQLDDGKIYGICQGGGDHNVGTLYAYDPIDQSIKALYHFSVAESGGSPISGPVLHSDGHLYGTTSGGGAYRGQIYRYELGTGSFVTLYEGFIDTSLMGGTPRGDLLIASNGKIYGNCRYGGSVNRGVFYQFDPATQNYVVKQDYTGTNGSEPYGSWVELNDDAVGMKDALVKPSRLKLYPNPVNDVLTIQSSLTSGMTEIYTVTGALMLQMKVGDLSTIQIPVAEFESGLYLIQLSDRDQQVHATFVKE